MCLVRWSNRHRGMPACNRIEQMIDRTYPDEKRENMGRLLGFSAVNIAYPIVAVIQALGTGIGMGGAIYYSINKAEKKDARAKEFTAGALWLLIISSIILTVSIFFLNSPLLRLLGASGQLLF